MVVLLHHSVFFLLVIMISTLLELHVIVVVQCRTHPGDTEVLKDLKNGVNPMSISTGSCLSSWDFSFDPCDNIFTDKFTCGFRCDLIVSGLSRITEISLDQAGYSGSLSNTSSWNLPCLQVLDLSYNSLSGPLPYALSNLTRLRRLSLSKNSFTGPIPSSLTSLSHLQELYMDSNRLIGAVPDSLNRLASLKRLELQQNNLTGTLPDLTQFQNLYFLDLSDNNLSGVFPVTLPEFIVELSLRNNNLRGELPKEIGGLRFLQVLDLSHNALSGAIPAVLFDHHCLQQLTLSHNNFTSLRVPEKVGLRSRLVAIDLSYNLIHGLLPAFMASMPKLSALSLEHNRFTGMIPTEFALKAVVSPKEGRASFERLLLGGNYLVGLIPGPFMGLKPGSAKVSLVDNCLFTCPDRLFFCQGGEQKSFQACKEFGPIIR